MPARLAAFATATIGVIVAAAAVALTGWWTLPVPLVLAALSAWSHRRGRAAMVSSVQRGAAARGPLLNFARKALETTAFKTSPALRRALSDRFDDLGTVRAAVIFRTTWVQLRTLLTVEVAGLAVFLIALWSVVVEDGALIAPCVVVYAAFTFTQQAAGDAGRLEQRRASHSGTSADVGRVVVERARHRLVP